MNCPHAQTTTLLWLYGDGPESHETHLMHCEACQGVCAEHGNVMDAVHSVLPAIGPASTASVEETPVVKRSMGLWASMLAAAVVLIFINTNPTENVDTAIISHDGLQLSTMALTSEGTSSSWSDELDFGIEELAADFDNLEMDMILL
jgi:hypothetical protein